VCTETVNFENPLKCENCKTKHGGEESCRDCVRHEYADFVGLEISVIFAF